MSMLALWGGKRAFAYATREGDPSATFQALQEEARTPSHLKEPHLPIPPNSIPFPAFLLACFLSN